MVDEARLGSLDASGKHDGGRYGIGDTYGAAALWSPGLLPDVDVYVRPNIQATCMHLEQILYPTMSLVAIFPRDAARRTNLKSTQCRNESIVVVVPKCRKSQVSIDHQSGESLSLLVEEDFFSTLPSLILRPSSRMERTLPCPVPSSLPRSEGARSGIHGEREAERAVR